MSELDFNDVEEPEGEVLLIALPVETNLFESGKSVDEITEVLVEAAYHAVKYAVELQLENRPDLVPTDLSEFIDSTAEDDRED